MHLGCPVRFVTASRRFICPCHGGVYGFQGEVDGGPPVRPLDRFYTQVEAGRVLVGPRFSRQLGARALLRRATRSSRSTASGSTSTRRGRARDASPAADPTLAATPPPPGPARDGAGAERQRNGEGRRPTAEERAAEVRVSAVGWLDERTGASPFLRGFLFRKVPKGTNWFYTLGSATMFAFLSQAVTGVFLAMYYDPIALARLRVDRSTSPTRLFLGEFVRGMHQWGSTRDGRARSSCTWGGRSSSARTSTRAS